MNKRNLIIIAIVVLCVVLISATGNTDSNIVEQENRYQMISPNDNNIIIFDTLTGEYWRKFIPSGSGPTEWTKETSPVTAIK